MPALPKSSRIARTGEWRDAADRVALDYEGRLLRRKRLTGEGGLAFLVELPQSTSLEEGDAFCLEDGRQVEIRAAEEPLYRVSGDLARLAWCVGTWRAPCEIGKTDLVIRRDTLLGRMLEELGATLSEVEGPFRPESGGRLPGQRMARVKHHAYRHHLAGDGTLAGDDAGAPG